MKMNHDSPMTEIKGIGEKTATLFHRMGIHTVGELLSYYPRAYDTYEAPVTFANLQAERVQAVTGFYKEAAGGEEAEKSYGYYADSGGVRCVSAPDLV